MEKHNWIRVKGNNFELMNFDQYAIQRIANFLGQELFDEAEEEEIYIEELKTGKWKGFSSAEIFEAADDPQKATRLLLKMRGKIDDTMIDFGPSGEEKMMPTASNQQGWSYKFAEENYPQDFDGNDLAGLDGTPVPINSDGTITLYHRTTNESAQALQKRIHFKSKEQGRVFASTKISGQAEGFGPAIIEFKVNPRLVRIEDAFPDGEVHISMPTSIANSSISQIIFEGTEK